MYQKMCMYIYGHTCIWDIYIYIDIDIDLQHTYGGTWMLEGIYAAIKDGNEHQCKSHRIPQAVMRNNPSFRNSTAIVSSKEQAEVCAS